MVRHHHRRRSRSSRRSGAREEYPRDERVQKTGEEERNDVEDDQVGHVVRQVETASQLEGTRVNVGAVGEVASPAAQEFRMQ